MARPKKNQRTPTTTEPEVLGPEKPPKLDTARAALATAQKAKGKRDEFMDQFVTWMENEKKETQGDPQIDIRILLRQVLKLERIDAASLLKFMKQIKADGRLQVEQVDDAHMVFLAGDLKLSGGSEQPDVDQTNDAPALHEEPSSEKAETKTIGEHVKDAKGRPTRLQFEHGIGTWVKSEFGPAQITNMHTKGSVTLYDLKTEGGKKLKEVPAFEIEKLSDQESKAIHDEAKFLKLIKHNEDGQHLAQMLAKEQAEEVEQAGELKATRKRIDKLREQIDAHLCGVPLDDQMKIDMTKDDGTAAVSSPSAPSTAAERLLGRISGKDVLTLTDDNQPWDKMKAATLKAEASNGKPQKIVPLTISQAPGNWVCVDLQDGVAVLLKALTHQEWNDTYREKFGKVRDLPNDKQDHKAEAGGPLTGCPVKVSRATLYLAPLDDALLLELPKAAAQA